MNQGRVPPDRSRQLRVRVLAWSLLATFAITRLILHAAPDLDLVLGPYDIHHLFTGALMIAVFGIPAVLQPRTALAQGLTTAGFGAGLALVLDEWFFLLATDGSNEAYVLAYSLVPAAALIFLAAAYSFALSAGAPVRRAAEPTLPSFWSTTMDTFRYDLVATFRGLVRAKGFSTVALLTLWMAFTANVITFSILNAIARPELPYDSPGRIASITEAYAPHGWVDTPLSLATVMDLRRHTTAFSSVAAHSQRRVSLADESREPVRVAAAVVTANTWSTLGVAPVLGRGFVDGDDAGGAPGRVMLGYRLWRDRYGLAPDILGRRVTVDGIAREVVGVMPEHFRFPEAEDLWLPLSAVLHADAGALDRRDARGWHVAARLVEDRTLDEANAELSVVSNRLAREHPQTHEHWSMSAVSVERETLLATGSFFGAMQTGALLLILILCANLGNLLLARSEQRGRELAIRAAVGASRGRLMCLVLLEPVALALAAAAAALATAAWLLGLLDLAIPEAIPFFIRFRVDTVVVIFAVLLALISGGAAGCASALRVPRSSLARVLTGNAATSTGPRRAGWLRSAFLFIQTAVAAALLATTLLVASGLMRFGQLDLGFEPANTLHVDLPLPASQRGDAGRLRQFAANLLEGVQRIPGVDAAAIAAAVPLAGASGEGPAIDVDGSHQAARADAAPAGYLGVSPGYFKAMGMPVLGGRPFTDHDRAGAAPVAIVNAEAARRLFGSPDALGRRIRFGRTATEREWRTVVGLVADTVLQPLDPEIEPRIYVPYEQDPGHALAATLRSARETGPLTRELTAVLRQVDPWLAYETPVTGRQRLHLALWPLRLFNGFAGALALFGVLVASAGVYGLTRYVTLARTREIGIRLALGAGRGAIARMMIRTTGLPVLAGLLAGVVASVPISSVLQHIIAGAPGFDPVPVMMSAAALAAVGFVAVGLPAWRATRIRPSDALRS